MAQGGDVRARILDVAAKLFMEQGYAATSVREIGERAAVGQSSLYHHVQSKGQLLYQLHQNFSRDLIDRLHAVVAANASPTDQLRGLIRVFLLVVETHQAEVTVFLREAHALPDGSRQEIQRDRDEVDAILDRMIANGIEAGELRQGLDVRLTRMAILGMCNWTYQWYQPGGGYANKEVADFFADVVINGLREQPTSAQQPSAQPASPQPARPEPTRAEPAVVSSGEMPPQ